MVALYRSFCTRLVQLGPRAVAVTNKRWLSLTSNDHYRAVACDVTGGVASLNFDATELKIFYGNLGSPGNPNLQYERFETYH